MDKLITAANIGLAGVGLLGFVRGWIVPGKIYENEKTQREKVQNDYKELAEVFQNQIMPEFERGRNANESLAMLLDSLLKKIRT